MAEQGEYRIIESAGKLAKNLQVYTREIVKETEKVDSVRVAAYCRVSTNLDTQKSSLEIQMAAFTKIIQENHGWKLAGIYTDKGVTGTSAKKRSGFQNLIRDAENGLVDLILTKSISRFARNTVDALQYTRYLGSLGVGVIFEEQKIDTRDAVSEMLFTIHAAFAQEESRSISENFKRGIRHRYALGQPRWAPLYGYRKTEDNAWVINEDEASVVREIFNYYISGWSLPEIAVKLNSKSFEDRDTRHFSPITISKILHNERYIGDVAMQKYYIDNYLTHKLVRNNRAVVSLYYLKDHHPAIVDKDIFRGAQIQAVMKDKHRGSQQYPYYGFLRCPTCGQNMVSISLPQNGHGRIWTCGGVPGSEVKRRKRTKCPPVFIKEDYVHQGVWSALDCLDDTEPVGLEGAKALANLCRDEKKKTIEYFFLNRFVDHISFITDEGRVVWNCLIVYWKNGMSCVSTIHFNRPSDIPVTAPRLVDGVYYADERVVCRRGGSSRNAYNVVMREREFCQEVQIIDKPRQALVEGIPELGYVDLPVVLTPDADKDFNRKTS